MANSTWRAADDTFGPFVESISRTSFDFTRLFEESIFSIGPSVLLLLVAPFRILYLSKAPRRVARSRLAISKLVSTNRFGPGRRQADRGTTATSSYFIRFTGRSPCTMDYAINATHSCVRCCCSFVVCSYCGLNLSIIYGALAFDPTELHY